MWTFLDSIRIKASNASLCLFKLIRHFNCSVASPADQLHSRIILDIRWIIHMSNSITCTQDDLAHGIVCLSRGQSIGLAVDAEAGLISLTALLGAFVWIFVGHYSRG